MNTLALIGGGLLLLVGLIVAVAKLAASREHERIRRWLAERAQDRSQDAVRAHEQAEEQNREFRR